MTHSEESHRLVSLPTAFMRRRMGKVARFLASLVPESVVALYERLVTRNPLSFNEKILHKMAHDRRPILTLFADKLRVRTYVEQRVGHSVLTTLYATAANARDITWGDLPREYVAKVNHGSGGVVVVSGAADPSLRLPPNAAGLPWTRFFIHPDSLDITSLTNVLNRWLSMTYSSQKLFSVREWAYKDIAPLVQVEEYVGTTETLPAQIDVICLNGRPEELQYYPADTLFGDNLQIRFLRDDFEAARAHLNLSAMQWNELLRMCEVLSQSMDLLRVDWMLTARGVIFNELTNYPAGGRLTLIGNPLHPPPALNDILSDLWPIPQDPGVTQ